MPDIVFGDDDRAVLLVEFGMFTNLPTGFRILNYTKNKLKADVFKIMFKDICKAAGLRKRKTSENRLQQMERRIDKFFDTVGT